MGWYSTKYWFWSFCNPIDYWALMLIYFTSCVGFFVPTKKPTGKSKSILEKPDTVLYYCVGSVGYCRLCRVFRPTAAMTDKYLLHPFQLQKCHQVHLTQQLCQTRIWNCFLYWPKKKVRRSQVVTTWTIKISRLRSSHKTLVPNAIFSDQIFAALFLFIFLPYSKTTVSSSNMFLKISKNYPFLWKCKD